MVFEGLHPIYDEKARSQLDLAIYIDARMFFRGVVIWELPRKFDFSCSYSSGSNSGSSGSNSGSGGSSRTSSSKLSIEN